ncbi:FAD-dependent oxidoreductase [Aspergillus fijiensis CBS 313.89]|uniref:FAD/NAD(P)-binding domain-containing protein n=1 Tax=Aspergillus fijiensis CBS 313.89 TaxID=1448319 RepID=A0A8G1RJ98_9EURO|nr:FAD/NAD(P)-binding domain-containing protein [Aspergillus fijiensis CBS 313.89]RAK75022.1 FAD/NAD(P)-binding domain-containing protein [Aspergillus fijiensis CBS 313.89]
MNPTPSFAIIGGGPSGLLFARLLEINGITDYVVYERDESAIPSPWQQGGTLDLRPSSGQLALRRADLFDQFSKFARWDASCFHMLYPDGTTAIRHDQERDAPEIDRLHLRQLLLESIPAHKIRWGHAVRAVERREADGSQAGSEDGDIVIHFLNGTIASGFRLVVGADGAWSKVRPLITAAKPVYSGKMFIEGRLTHDNPGYAIAKELVGPGSMFAAGHHKKLAVQRVSNGTYRVYFGLQAPEDFYHHRECSSGPSGDEDLNNRTEQLRSLLLLSDEYFATWGPQLRKFVETAEGPFRAWPLYRMDPEKLCWSGKTPGLTLLGDAAHVSTPFVGEGVNCSLYDAVVLADSIVKHCGDGAGFDSSSAEKLNRALEEYEEDMLARGRDLIERSTAMEKVFFSEDAVAGVLEFFKSFSEKSE